MKLKFFSLPMTKKQAEAADAFALALEAAPLSPQYGDVVVFHAMQDYYGEVVHVTPETGRCSIWMYDPFWQGGSWYRQYCDLDKIEVLIPGGALSVYALYPQEAN